MKLKVIVTGVTGMVGEGVVHECLLHPQIESVLVVGRRPCNIKHEKLKEIVHPDFFDLSAIANQLCGYDACYFCLGTTSIRKTEEEYYKMTYTLTMHFAETVSNQNKEMTFCYVSGSGTDSTEKGKMMWARVKGKTENDLMKLPFKKVYNFRPGFMKPTKGLKNVLPAYNYFIWLFPLLNLISSNLASTLKDVGLAMINVTLKGYDKNTIEVKDINIIAKAS